MNHRIGSLLLEDDGRITLQVRDLDAADVLASTTGLEHEDGFFDLGPVEDVLIATDRKYSGLAATLLPSWLALGRLWESERAERIRPETYTVPSYTGGL